jgi:hypothetical protein
MTIDRKDIRVLSFIAVLGLLYRLFYIYYTSAVIDSDEAIVGLMAKHALESGYMPIFYYGQHYMGSLEPLLVTLLFAIFGISAVALKMVPLFFAVGLIPLCYLLTRFFFANDPSIINSHQARLGALFASLLMALPPAAMVEWSTKARGGFTEVIFIGLLAMLVTLKWYRTLAYREIFWCALLLGVGWWVNNQIIFFILPIFLLILYRGIYVSYHLGMFMTMLRQAMLGFLCFFIGSLLYWFYNLQTNFASLGMLGGARNLGDNLYGLFSSALPIISGARQFWHDQDIFSGASWVALGLYIVIFNYLRKGYALFWFPALFLCVAMLVSAPLIFSFSSFGTLVSAPRYLLPLYPVLFACVGVAVVSVKNGSLRYAIAGALLVLHICSYWWNGPYDPGEPFTYNSERVSRDHKELLAFLSTNNIKVVKAPYWLAYRLAFESREQVKPVLIGDPYQVRIPAYELYSDSNSAQLSTPFVVTPEFGGQIIKGLKSLGYDFEVAVASGYIIIYKLKSKVAGATLVPIDKSNIIVSSNINNDLATAAIDGDVLTRWASALPQNNTMIFRVQFKIPQNIRAFEYRLGQWATDFPRSFQIDCVDSNGVETRLLSASDYENSRLLFSTEHLFYQFLTPFKCQDIFLHQVGYDRFYDWSIAELKFYN